MRKSISCLLFFGGGGRLQQTVNLRYFLCNKIKIINCEMFQPYDILKGLKCCTKTLCMTTETLPLMGNSSMPQSLDVLVDVRRLQLNLCQHVWPSNCKPQTSTVPSQTSSHVSRKINEHQPLRFCSQTKYLVRRFRSF